MQMSEDKPEQRERRLIKDRRKPSKSQRDEDTVLDKCVRRLREIDEREDEPAFSRAADRLEEEMKG